MESQSEGRKDMAGCLLIQLYLEGLSTRQIAQRLSIPKSTVAARIKASGNSRARSLACILRRPSQSRHWRTCRDMARRYWTRAKGPIPAQHEIHHLDKDWTNNNLENLECLPKWEHRRVHQIRYGSLK